MRCLRWAQWHAAWVYRDPLHPSVTLPSFTPPPWNMRLWNVEKSSVSGDIPPDRPSMRSGDSIANSDKRTSRSSEGPRIGDFASGPF